MTFARTSLLCVLMVALAPAQDRSQLWTGLQEDGSSLLPNGWLLTPVGPQVEVSTLPMAGVAVPSTPHVLVLNAGFLRPSVSVIDPDAVKEVQRVSLPDGWGGIVAASSGEKVFVAGGGSGQVYLLGQRDGSWAVTAGYRSGPEDGPPLFTSEVALSPDDRMLYVGHLLDNRISMLNARTGFRVGEFEVGRRPRTILPLPDGKHLLVSQWGASSVGLYRVPEGELVENLTTCAQPADIAWVDGQLDPEADDAVPLVARLFVACSSGNSVAVYGATSGLRFTELERLDIALTARAPVGSTPLALELNADGDRLYVVNANNNAVVVADVSEDRTPLVGVIPTGWYPTDVVALQDGGLVYLNGKGFGTQAQPNGPNPLDRARPAQYGPAVQTGSVGILPVFDEEIYAELTPRAVENAAYSDAGIASSGAPSGNPVPSSLGEASPIRHVVWVVVENRTFDQIFGDVTSARARSELALLGGELTPNYHALASQFVLLDNFTATGDVSVDGWSSLAGGMTAPFVELLWPTYYSGRIARAEWEREPVLAHPPAGFLWDQFRLAGRSADVYGIEPWLARGVVSGTEFAVGTPDRERVTAFLDDASQREGDGSLPELSVIALPGSHTAGDAPGYPTAVASMAEHDQALGQLIAGLSELNAWEQMAVFVTGDDAQDGADHVDSHRTVGLVIGPYARRGSVDSTQYSNHSVARTIEFFFGLRPMTQFDAGANTLWRSFDAEADARRYSVRPSAIDLDQKVPGAPASRPRRVAAPWGVSGR